MFEFKLTDQQFKDMFASIKALSNSYDILKPLDIMYTEQKAKWDAEQKESAASVVTELKKKKSTG